MITRRLFVASVASVLAAPAIVRASSLMPVRKFIGTYHGVPIYEIYGRSPAMDALPMMQELAEMRRRLTEALYRDLFDVIAKVDFDRSAFGTGVLKIGNEGVRYMPLSEIYEDEAEEDVAS